LRRWRDSRPVDGQVGYWVGILICVTIVTVAWAAVIVCIVLFA